MLLPFIKKNKLFLSLKIVFQWRPYVLQQSQGLKYIAKPQQKKQKNVMQNIGNQYLKTAMRQALVI